MGKRDRQRDNRMLAMNIATIAAFPVGGAIVLWFVWVMDARPY